jgi:glucose/arabinose dehydrogenase
MKRKLILIFIIIILIFSLSTYFVFFKNNLQKSPLNSNINIIITDLTHTTNYNIEKISDSIVATDIAFTPEGHLLFSEMSTGKIKILKDGKTTTFAQIPDSLIPIGLGEGEERGEAGPLSIEIDPDYEKNKYIYVYYTSDGSSKIGRYVDNDGIGENFKIIFDEILQWKIHNGGHLSFGKDEKIYLSTGDATPIYLKLGKNNPAQDILSPLGKILRINKDGSLPEDNPFPGSYTFAYGFRNVFAYATHPETGKIYVGDQGIRCCDELNIVEEGGNYGWPLEMGQIENSQYKQPFYSWNEETRVVPTGMVFYDGNKFPEEYKNNLFMGTWRTREIYRFVFDNEELTEIEILTFNKLPNMITGMHAGSIHEGQVTELGSAHPSNGFMALEVGPDGYLYFSDVQGIYRLSIEKEEISYS